MTGPGTHRTDREPAEPQQDVRVEEAVRAELGEPSEAVAELFGPRLATARRYAELLAGPAVDRGLLGPREVPRIWERHLANCAVVATRIPASSRVVDLGSGAGLPGIPLACVRSDIEVELVEPQLRRVRFLQECLEQLDLPGVTVTRARAEQVTGREADCVVARAVAPLERLVLLALPVLRTGGALLALKGDRAEDEVTAAAATIRSIGGHRPHVEVCGQGVVDPPTRVVVVVKSTAGR